MTTPSRWMLFSSFERGYAEGRRIGAAAIVREVAFFDFAYGHASIATDAVRVSTSFMMGS